jgi:hypothetical protein
MPEARGVVQESVGQAGEQGSADAGGELDARVARRVVFSGYTAERKTAISRAG